MIEGIISGAVYIVVALKVCQRNGCWFYQNIGTGCFESFDGLSVFKKYVVLKRGITPSRRCRRGGKIPSRSWARREEVHLTLGKVCVGLFGVGERLLSRIDDDGVELRCTSLFEPKKVE